MNRDETLAFLVWAIDTDRMSFSVIENLKKFKETAASMKKVFTDPNDPQLYCGRVVDMDDIAFFTDYILVMCDAERFGTLKPAILEFKKEYHQHQLDMADDYASREL